MLDDKIDIIESSGNVFEDLGLPNADELQYKAGLVFQIAQLIEERGLSQTEASRLLGVPQPKLPALLRGNFTGFSTDRLFRMLRNLGQDIEIKITPMPKRKADAIGGSVNVSAPKPAKQRKTVPAAARKNQSIRMQG